MRNRKAPATVDEYLAAVPEPARSTLRKIRTVIQSVVPPDAVEKISYGMPMFHYKGMLAGFAAFKNHCSLFHGAFVLATFQTELKNYQTSKGTIQFPMDKPLPTALLKKMVKAAIAENVRRKKR